MSSLLPVLTENARPVLEGEILPRLTPVVVSTSPFKAEVRELTLEKGFTLAELLAATGLPEALHDCVHILIADQEVHRRFWHCVRPRPGKTVYVRVQPQGGGGAGGGRKNVLASVLMLAVSVAASAFAPMILGAVAPGLAAAGGVGAALGTSLIGAGITMLGALAISALVPPPNTGPDFPGQRAMIQSVRNRMVPYGTIPRIFGKRRVYPMLASRPYTEAMGDNRYLRVLLVIGYGPLDITNIKIGETPISAFNSIKVHINNGWDADHDNFASGRGTTDSYFTYHPQAVTEDAFQILLPHAGTGSGNTGPGAWQERVTAANTDEFVVEVTAPQGLCDYELDGEKSPLKIEIEVQYRLASATDPTPWTVANWDGNDEADGTETNGVIVMEDESSEPIVKGGRVEVPTGQYRVRVRRKTASYEALGEGNNNAEVVQWTALRSILDEKPIQRIRGLCTIALLMKATDQFNGFPDTINCEAQAYLPIYNGSSWAWGLTNGNSPAMAYADVLRRRGTRRLLSDSRIDLARIRAWQLDCDATPANEPTGDMWTFNAVLDGGSVYEACKRIAAAGRAQYTIRDGLHSVVQDKVQATAVQHFTPRNTWGYSGTKAFLDRPHALRVQFPNKDKGWMPDERVVYDDGYSEANATRFEVLELPDCTSSKQAFREGRYFMAVGQLRPEEHQISCDIENLRCTVGDRVELAHDVISVGIASGRIVSRTVNGSNQITAFTLDCAVPRFVGTSYRLLVRSDTGTMLLYNVKAVTSPEDDNVIELASPIANSGVQGDSDDLFTYGISGSETAPCIVKAIVPGEDLTARITLAPYSAAIFTSDTNAIPDFDANINDDTTVEELRPDPPSIRLSSGEYTTKVTSDGTLFEGIRIAITEARATRRQSQGFRVMYRRKTERTWKEAPGSPAKDSKTTFLLPARKGHIYQIRAKTLGTRRVNSAWVYSGDHTVGGSTRVPPVPLSFTGVPMFRANFLTWNEPDTYLGFSHTEIYAVKSNSAPTAPTSGTAATHKTGKQNWTHGGLGDLERWYYWARSVDRNKAKSAWVAMTGAFLVTNKVTTSGIETGAVTTETIATNALTTPRRGWWPKTRVLMGNTTNWTTLGKLSIKQEPGFNMDLTFQGTVWGEGHGWVQFAVFRGSTQVFSWIEATGQKGWKANRGHKKSTTRQLNGTYTYTLRARVATSRMRQHGYPTSRDMRVGNVFFGLQQYKR